MQSISLVFITNQLRVSDNPLLVRCLQYPEPILVAWIPPNWKEKHILLDIERIGRFRRKFLWESLLQFRKSLQEFGGNVIVASLEDIEESNGIFWSELKRTFTVRRIILADEPGFYESQFLDRVKAIGDLFQYPVISMDCNGLFSHEDIRTQFSKIPFVFTEFRKRLEVDRDYPVRSDMGDVFASAGSFHPGEVGYFLGGSEIRKGLSQLGFVSWKDFETLEKDRNPIPSLSIENETDPRIVMEFQGGEESAWNRLMEYFWDRDKLQSYKETRNGMIGADYSSKFSPWLAVGAISPVSVYREILKYERMRIRNESTYWMKFEILWREFFRWVVRQSGKKVFHYSGIRGKTPIGLSRDLAKFHLWMKGETGDDYVDANMQELFNTGFMSNRGRQNVASYLVHGLNLDWRLGAEWFESQLIDYDVGSNWGNWNYVAGVGNDPRNRVFNTEKQATDYDPNGDYRRLWLSNR